MNRLQRRLVSFWTEDRGLSVFLLVLFVTCFVAAPLSPLTPWSRPILSTFVSIMFACGAFAVAHRRANRYLIAGLATAPIVLEWARDLRPSTAMGAAASLASLAFAATLIVLITGRVFREGPITIHRVIGSVVVYLLIGMAFGELARFIDILAPGAYAVAPTQSSRQGALYYFSFVTLTTLGYGDITPLHPFARSAAVVEGLTGQLFPAILIARLVSQELASRGSRR